MKNKINLIINLIFVVALFVCTSIVFAWFIPNYNSTIISTGDISLSIFGYVNQIEADGETSTNYPQSLSNSKITVNLDYFDNSLIFAFVITNDSNIDSTVEIKLSDFGTYIFDSYNSECKITDETKNKANKYNSKFFLYFDKITSKEGNCITITDTSISFDDSNSENLNIIQTVNTDSYLWQYSLNESFISFELASKATKTIFITLKNAQSSYSIINDYRTWLHEKGEAYIKDYFNDIEEEQAISNYLDNYYNIEVSTLLGENQILPNTEFDIDYFEFVGSSKNNIIKPPSTSIE